MTSEPFQLAKENTIYHKRTGIDIFDLTGVQSDDLGDNVSPEVIQVWIV